MTSTQPPFRGTSPVPSREALRRPSMTPPAGEPDEPGTSEINKFRTMGPDGPARGGQSANHGPDLTQPVRKAEDEVVQLRTQVKSLADMVESLTEKVDELQAADSAHASKHASEQERRLREADNKSRDLREAMRSLAESVEQLQSSECSAEERVRALFRAQVMITHARSYWRVDGASEIDDPLAAVDRALNERLAHPDVSADGTSEVIAAVVRIGAATLFVACIGAPIGAIVVDDAVVKEMVKTAIAAFVGQTAMELTELGIDRVRGGTRHGPGHPP